MDELIDSNLKLCKSFMLSHENLNVISKKFINNTQSRTISGPSSNAIVLENRKGTKDATICKEPNVNKPIVIEEAEAACASQKSPDFFIPYQKDKLFWCFYIILFGMEKYERDISHSFSVEKKLKIESIEKMSGPLSQKLKELKIKRIDLETELLSNNCVSLKSLYALCAIHSTSLIIVAGNKYYKFDFDASNSNTTISDKNNIIYRQPSGEFAVYKSSAGNGAAANILDSLYLVENVCKPLKSLASYLLSDLKELCNKMNIPIEDSNGKHKPKNKLYEDVLLFMNS